MIVDLDDYIKSDTLSVFVKNVPNVIIKRDDNDFILVDIASFTYTKINKVNTSEELSDLGIFPRKGNEQLSWYKYKQLKDIEDNEEFVRPF